MDNNNLFGSDNQTADNNNMAGNPYEGATQTDNGATGNPYAQQDNSAYQQPYAGQNNYAGQPYAGQNYGGQQTYQAYGQPNYYNAQEEPQKASGLAIGSMVCGILSIVLCCVWYISGILAIVAIVLGTINNVKKQGGKGMAIAGIITGAIGLILAIAFIAIVFVGVVNGGFEDFMY